MVTLKLERLVVAEDHTAAVEGHTAAVAILDQQHHTVVVAIPVVVEEELPLLPHPPTSEEMECQWFHIT